MNKEIKIIVSGGLIQDIENIPQNIQVKVFDFDTEGDEFDPGAHEMIEGKMAYVSIWTC